MKINVEKQTSAYAIKIVFTEKAQSVARAYVYVLTNGLHDKPFGFLEDVYVEEKHRGGGLGTKIVKRAIVEAEKAGCYKLVGTSRYQRPEVHRFYERLGFKKHGHEFRLDFN